MTTETSVLSNSPFTEFVIEDVRHKSDFNPEYYPNADGDAFKDVEGSDLSHQRKSLFLSLYYLLNKAYDSLAQARSNENESIAEHALLEIRRLYDRRQELEVHYAPMGFIGEPELVALKTTNVVFSHSRLGNHNPTEKSPLSAFVTIDLPPEIQAAAFGSEDTANS